MFSCGSAAAFMQGIRGWGNETGAALVGMRGGNEEARVRDEDDVAGARAATLARANGPLAVCGRSCCSIWAEGRRIERELADKTVSGLGAFGASKGSSGSADCTRDHAGPDGDQLQGKEYHPMLQGRVKEWQSAVKCSARSRGVRQGGQSCRYRVPRSGGH